MANAAVNLQDECLRAAIENWPEAVVLVDRWGAILAASADAAEMFGHERGALVGASVLTLVPPRFHERIPMPVVGSPGSARRRIHAVGARRDQSEFPVEISIGSLDAAEGPVFVGVLRDSSERRAAGGAGHAQDHDELLQHLSDLAHVSRLSTMGEMAAGLAHELNQPLYAISNYAKTCEMLARDSPLADELREVVEKLVAQTQRAAEIVRRLRRFVSRREPRRFSVDVNHLAREVQQLMLFHAHRFAIETRLRLAPALPRVWADAILIEQVIVNLVRNAFESMGDRRRANAEVVIETGLDEQGMIFLKVIDNGPGFEGIALEHLFEPFHTTKEQGMGLGLPISRSIVEAHGGRLTAASPPGGGAMVMLTLPAHQETEHG